MDHSLSSSAAGSGDTRERILDEAERLVQTRGYNGFSYAHIAKALGVTKASLHYHFSNKAELGRYLIERYGESFEAALLGIDESGTGACDRLKRYVEIYEHVLEDDRMCLCGMLAAEYVTLPEIMQKSISTFFDLNEAWLTKLLEKGRAAGELQFANDAREAANALIGSLEGAMLVSRAHGGREGFRASARLLVEKICRAR